jgi:hypothetical protein
VPRPYLKAGEQVSHSVSSWQGCVGWQQAGDIRKVLHTDSLEHRQCVLLVDPETSQELRGWDRLRCKVLGWVVCLRLLDMHKRRLGLVRKDNDV